MKLLTGLTYSDVFSNSLPECLKQGCKNTVGIYNFCTLAFNVFFFTVLLKHFMITLYHDQCALLENLIIYVKGLKTLFVM